MIDTDSALADHTLRRGAPAAIGSKRGAERSGIVPVRGAIRVPVPPMALGPLNEKQRINSPTKGPPMIHKGINAFMTNSQLRIYGTNVAQKTCALKAPRSAICRKKFLSFPKKVGDLKTRSPS